MANEPGKGDGPGDGKPDASGYKRTYPKKTKAQKKAVNKLRKEMGGWASHGRPARFVPGRGGR